MNTFGNTFRLTTFGESHGPAIGGIIDGCPAGRVIDQDFILVQLRRRREGDTPTEATTTRRESDHIEWLSGLMDGVTLGTPIAFVVRNSDCRPNDYDALHDCFRPGHADYTYQQKYGIRDHRGGGRASGRETVARVVAGAVAQQLLMEHNISIHATNQDRDITCTVQGVPAGIGEPVFNRLNARLAFAMMSIPSAASFAMGGWDIWRLPSNEFADAWQQGGTADTLTSTNHCGGIQGGISNGMPIVFHVGFHPPLTNPEGMICRLGDGSLKTVSPHGRHDRDHGTRLPVIVESMTALTLADFIPFSHKSPAQ